MIFYNRPKIKKSQQPAKTFYTLYEIHSIDKGLRVQRWKGNYYQVTILDPATKNLALRIEKRYHDGHIEPLQFLRVDISPKEGEEQNCSVYNQLSLFLESFLPLFRESHFVLIERQLPENYRCVRISQHLLTYFIEKLRDNPLLPVLAEIDPKVKYREAPRAYTLHVLKKTWGPQRAQEILKARKDELSLIIMDKERKKDDLADTVLLAENFFPLLGINFILP